jgi:hypothetical protein
MSVRIGIIISKDYDFKSLDDFKDKYDLGFLKICNEYVKKQLFEDEMFLQATRTGCDSLTGIGAYDLYTKDVSFVFQNIDDKLIAQSVADEFEERKQNYKVDALRWIEIINILKNVYKIKKLGLFWHNCSEAFDKEQITFSNRVNCPIKDITVEYMMKIKPDTIVFFN